MQDYDSTHQAVVAKMVLHYLKLTHQNVLTCNKTKKLTVVVYADADAEDFIDRKST